MENIIKEYIKKLTVNDIKSFAKKKNIDINENEVLILYNYAKNHYEDFLNNEDMIIKELRKKLSPNTFKEVYKLYLEYKIKYLS